VVRIGTAGWSIPKQYTAEFPGEGTHLQRYARRFSCVEINSSFYRPHKAATYARWAASVPADFRFAVKVPREITHVRKLVSIAEPLDRFLSEARTLGERLGPLLVQLPPDLGFDEAIAAAFFDRMRSLFDGLVVCEPRHRSWFTERAEALLVRGRVGRAAVDPAPVPDAASPGGWPELMYYRLHGSPQIYYSQYQSDYLDRTARAIGGTAGPDERWCIFDNTALGYATHDALAVMRHLDLG